MHGQQNIKTFSHILCLCSSLLPGIEEFEFVRYCVGRPDGGVVIADLSVVMLQVI